MAAKNEAKIRFSADTKEFNDGIKAANNELSSLRGELKLNDAQMKATGTTVEGLQNKQKNLTAQLEAQQDKTQALSEKLRVATQLFGDNSDEAVKLKNQLTASQTAEVKLQTAITNCNAQLQNQIDEQNRVKTSSEKLNDSIGEQQSELTKLKRAYVDAVLEFGEASDEARGLAGQIDSLSGDLKENKDRMEDAKRSANDLDRSMTDAGDAAGTASDGGFTVFKGALADLASNAIQAVIGKLGELVNYMASLPEATLELRQDMATLTTAFDNVGFSTDEATDTWKNLYAVFGEDDRAVEAANNIARMADSQKDLDDWVKITTGAWATYQDALPVEGLAESAGETAKVGKVTGVLADALNWSSDAAVMFAGYMSEDVTNAEDAFNVALTECTTEQERQALITDTLTTLYGSAADTYRDTAGAQMEAKEATAEATLAEANLADAIEPATTAWTKMKTTLLTAVAPAIEVVAGVLTDVFAWLGENPAVLYTIIGILGVVTVALGVLSVATAVQAAANSALMISLAPLILPILAIVAAIAAVIAIIVICVKHWDDIKAAAGNAWNWIVGVWQSAATWFDTNVIQPIAGFFSGLWQGIVGGVTAAWTWITGILATVGQWIYDNVIMPVYTFFSPVIEWFGALFTSIYTTLSDVIFNIIGIAKGCWEIIKAVWAVVSSWFDTNIIQPVAGFFQSMWDAISGAATTCWGAIVGVWNAVSGWFNTNIAAPVKNTFTGIWNTLTNGAKNAWNGIKSVFSSVASFFGKIFTDAWTKVKNVFSTGGKIFSGITDGIISAFKRVVNAIIGGINRVVAIPFNGINSALDKIRNISFLGISPFKGLLSSINVPQIPLLAEGGILTQPTLNIAGEAGAEAIVPIDKLQTYIESAIDKTMNNSNMAALVDAVSDLADRAIQLNINGRQFAVATATDTDNVSGNRLSLQKRGLAL